MLRLEQGIFECSSECRRDRTGWGSEEQSATARRNSAPCEPFSRSIDSPGSEQDSPTTEEVANVAGVEELAANHRAGHHHAQLEGANPRDGAGRPVGELVCTIVALEDAKHVACSPHRETTAETPEHDASTICQPMEAISTLRRAFRRNGSPRNERDEPTAMPAIHHQDNLLPLLAQASRYRPPMHRQREPKRTAGPTGPSPAPGRQIDPPEQ
jgi:hypothetical protein